jgi:hypothetical protein
LLAKIKSARNTVSVIRCGSILGAIMKTVAALLLLAGLPFSANTAVAATTDDVAWINKCNRDSAGMGAPREVVLKYCTCMNNKMDDNETLSITAWEKIHVAEAKACDRESGWK